MWRKILIIFLTLTVLAGLVSCNGSETTPGDTSAESTDVTTAPDSVSDEASTSVGTTDTTTTEAVTSAEETTAEQTAVGSTAETSALVTAEETTTEEITTEEVTTEEETTAPLIIDQPIGDVIDAEYTNNFRVSKAFSSNMVVQRGEFIRVWGFANTSQNGKKLSGEFMGMTADALIENGEWTLTFMARLDACTDLGNNMRIYTDTDEVIFTDVLVGDVYMVIGQSNVAYNVSTDFSYHGKNMSEIDKNKLIRINYNTLMETGADYPTRGTDEVCEDVVHNRGWTLATPSTISSFSALGYFFAEDMLELTQNQVPVGIIEIDGNGQPLGAFMSNTVADECGTDTFNASKGYYTTTGCNGDQARYMYNHYINPFEKYAISGIIWYQGESDFAPANANVFAQNFTALMTYMRTTHNLIKKDFPVYIIEFPSIYTAPAGATQWAYMDLGLIRSVLGKIPMLLPNSYLSVSCDLWDDTTFWNSLHPNCKPEQAMRTAEIAASVWCGIGSLEKVSGPVLKSVEFSEDRKTAVLTFDRVGSGLRTCDGSELVTGFKALRSSGTIIVKDVLTAKITSTDQITITSTSTLYGIAYNCVSQNYFGNDVNLCNSYGCPAGAFNFNQK